MHFDLEALTTWLPSHQGSTLSASRIREIVCLLFGFRNCVITPQLLLCDFFDVGDVAGGQRVLGKFARFGTASQWAKARFKVKTMLQLQYNRQFGRKQLCSSQESTTDLMGGVQLREQMNNAIIEAAHQCFHSTDTLMISRSVTETMANIMNSSID